MKFSNILSSSAVVAAMVAAGVVTFNEPAFSQHCRDSHTLTPERNSSLEFHRGQNWRTCSGYDLTFQSDGNLVLHDRRGRAIWSAERDRADVFAVQHDGNVVLYRRGRAIWDTGTAGNRGASFVIQSDGNLVVYSRAGGVLWSSHTTRR